METDVRITRAKLSECPECNGLGYTDETADLMETRSDREYGIVEKKTVKKGYGCLNCLGLGQVLAASLRAH